MWDVFRASWLSKKNIDFDDDMMIKENGDILPRYVLGCISPPTSRFPSVGTNQYTPVYVFNPQVVWFRRVLKSINFLLLNFQGPCLLPTTYLLTLSNQFQKRYSGWLSTMRKKSDKYHLNSTWRSYKNYLFGLLSDLYDDLMAPAWHSPPPKSKMSINIRFHVTLVQLIRLIVKYV